MLGTNTTVILAVMAVGALVETAVPMFLARPWQRGRQSANLGLTAVSFFFELVARILRSVCGGEVSAHRPMWRFHQIHPSDDFVDVTTTYRTHPVETGWRFLFAVVPVWLWPPLDRLLSVVPIA